MDSYEDILSSVSQQGNNIMQALSQQTNLTMTAPLANQFKMTSSIKDFFNSNMITIIIFLAILSTMLIYSLMLSDVNAKTYEYGMLRALGFKKTYLVQVISLKSISFSIPGLFLAIIIAISLNILLREFIYIEALNALDYDLTLASIILGVSFGLLVPLAANYFPIKSSMSTNLRDSLDLSRNNAKNDIGIKIERLEEVGISSNQLGLGIILVLIGTITYYGVPLSFLNENLFAGFFILSLI